MNRQFKRRESTPNTCRIELFFRPVTWNENLLPRLYSIIILLIRPLVTAGWPVLVLPAVRSWRPVLRDCRRQGSVTCRRPVQAGVAGRSWTSSGFVGVSCSVSTHPPPPRQCRCGSEWPPPPPRSVFPLHCLLRSLSTVNNETIA